MSNKYQDLKDCLALGSLCPKKFRVMNFIQLWKTCYTFQPDATNHDSKTKIKYHSRADLLTMILMFIPAATVA